MLLFAENTYPHQSRNSNIIKSNYYTLIMTPKFQNLHRIAVKYYIKPKYAMLDLLSCYYVVT